MRSATVTSINVIILFRLIKFDETIKLVAICVCLSVCMSVCLSVCLLPAFLSRYLSSADAVLQDDTKVQSAQSDKRIFHFFTPLGDYGIKWIRRFKGLMVKFKLAVQCHYRQRAHGGFIGAIYFFTPIWD